MRIPINQSVQWNVIRVLIAAHLSWNPRFSTREAMIVPPGASQVPGVIFLEDERVELFEGVIVLETPTPMSIEIRYTSMCRYCYSTSISSNPIVT